MKDGPKGASLLVRRSVLPSTWLDYERRHTAFLGWARESKLLLTDPQRVTLAMLEYFDTRYLAGESAPDGEKTLAAWEAYHPEYLKSCLTARLQRALKGWRKAAPGNTRWTLPQLLMFAIAGSLCMSDLNQMALFVVLAF